MAPQDSAVEKGPVRALFFGFSGFRVGQGGIGLVSGARASQHGTPMRDTELVQKLLGLPAPWQVTAVAVQVASGDTRL